MEGIRWVEEEVGEQFHKAGPCLWGNPWCRVCNLEVVTVRKTKRFKESFYVFGQLRIVLGEVGACPKGDYSDVLPQVVLDLFYHCLMHGISSKELLSKR